MRRDAQVYIRSLAWFTATSLILINGVSLMNAPVSTHDPVGGILDPATLATWVVNQIFAANVTDLFPTFPSPIFRTSRNDYYRLKPCPRADIASCLYYGNSSNGLPKSLQGIFWMEDIGIEDEAVGMAGDWDPVKRSLAICAGCTRNWAYKDTSSQRVPPFNWWSASGAALYNLAAWTGGFYEFFLNKDLNYGEVQARFKILYQTVYVPTWALNFSMALQPDGTWYRESKVFFNLIDSPAGRYTFKNIIDGEGKPGPFFNEWVAARNGSPTRIPLQVVILSAALTHLLGKDSPLPKCGTHVLTFVTQSHLGRESGKNGEGCWHYKGHKARRKLL